MGEPGMKLARAPIVEAVVDIDCDMPPELQIAELEGAARESFQSRYPKVRTQFIEHHKIEPRTDAPPKMSVKRGVQALHFCQDDEKQLVQLRREGFSFNRLAPYSTLDAYLAEIERTWRLFVQIVAPVQTREIRLRYINRILLPGEGGRVDLEQYLQIGPRLPDEDRLTFMGFLNQHAAVEASTGNEVNIILTSQPEEQGKLPIIFDITAGKAESLEPNDWVGISSRIQSLRDLKNHIFQGTLTQQCLNLFQ